MQLHLLALDRTVQLTSSFLWSLQLLSPSKRAGDTPDEPWPSSRLSEVIKREFQASLNTTANTLIWRHAAIAISRRHLQGSQFKKDYDHTSRRERNMWNDAQAGHTSLLAGSIYARGIEEAPGHVASARAEYRLISRAWHTFLGF